MSLLAELEALALEAPPATLLQAAERLRLAATPQGSAASRPATNHNLASDSPVQPRMLPFTAQAGCDDELEDDRRSLPRSAGSRAGSSPAPSADEAEASSDDGLDEPEWVDGVGRLELAVGEKAEPAASVDVEDGCGGSGAGGLDDVPEEAAGDKIDYGDIDDPLLALLGSSFQSLGFASGYVSGDIQGVDSDDDERRTRDASGARRRRGTLGIADNRRSYCDHVSKELNNRDYIKKPISNISNIRHAGPPRQICG